MFKYIALALILLAITGILSQQKIRDTYQGFKDSGAGEYIKEGAKELDQSLTPVEKPLDGPISR